MKTLSERKFDNKYGQGGGLLKGELVGSTMGPKKKFQNVPFLLWHINKNALSRPKVGQFFFFFFFFPFLLVVVGLDTLTENFSCCIYIYPQGCQVHPQMSDRKGPVHIVSKRWKAFVSKLRRFKNHHHQQQQQKEQVSMTVIQRRRHSSSEISNDAKPLGKITFLLQKSYVSAND